MYELKISKIDSEALIPSYAHEDDAGMDLYSIEEMEIEPSCTVLIRTGIKIELPIGTEAQIRPRSGLALKHGITVLNSPGTIDAGYRGEIAVILINHSKEIFVIEKHMKIAQMVIKPIYKVKIIETNDLTDSQRGQGGFGSTGLK